MKGYTLLFAKADKDSGYSIVRIGTDLGEFEAIAECCYEDLPTFSNYFGCGLAEARAIKKYAKAKVKYFRAQLEALKNYYATMSGTRNWNENDFYVKKLIQHIQKTEKQINHWKLVIKAQDNMIKTRIQQRDEYLTKRGEEADDSIYG